MKKKFVSVVLAVLMVASLTTACGGKSDKKETASAPAAETQTETKSETSAPEAEAQTEAEPEAETESEAAPAETGGSEDFTLLDVSSDMVDAGVYARSDDGTELVFTMFTEPSGTPMASLFIFPAAGEGDVICGAYTAESETDEDGIAWTLLTVTDAYTDGEFEIGFGESDDEVYIFDTEGTPYEGAYLSADETIDYMAQAAYLLEEGVAGGDAADSGTSEDFTLLDVSTDMIDAGVYAKSDDGTELVFSMFTEPSGTPMASLFIFPASGEGDVICGAYTSESETDEDGITWTLLTVTDAYTDGEFEIGFGESGDEVYIFDTEGTPYEGEYLSADDTINYMGTAAALME